MKEDEGRKEGRKDGCCGKTSNDCENNVILCWNPVGEAHWYFFFQRVYRRDELT